MRSNDAFEPTTPIIRRNTSQNEQLQVQRSLSEGPLYLADESLSMEEKIAASEAFKPTFKGMLELIIGPMFAGKSTELLRRVKRHAISGKACMYVKFAADNRYDSTSISTHDL